MHLTGIIKELFWRLSWLLGLFHLAKHAQRRRLRILCYHGFELHDESRFKPGLFMSTATFKKRLQLIHRYGFTVLPLDEALQRLRARSLPPHSVTITIDDGFHSVSRVGAALLHAYHYPATIYVTTYYVQHQRPVFRLLIQYMFWKTAQRHIVLPECTWNRDTVVDLNDPSARHRLMWACIDHGERRCSEEGREQLAREFAGLLGIDYEQLAASRMFALMTPARCLPLDSICSYTRTITGSRPTTGPEPSARSRRTGRSLGQWSASPPYISVTPADDGPSISGAGLQPRGCGVPPPAPRASTMNRCPDSPSAATSIVRTSLSGSSWRSCSGTRTCCGGS